ncbi:MAG TPA: hypothetical protein VHK89_00980 [Actinomycetota bacterium]|nr:hypothetical protein [Actinomycetota bacterium]
MADRDAPIAWMAVGKGHPVVGAEGDHVGKVSRVIADEQRDIFSGIAFRPGLLEGERYAPAALVQEITEEAIVLSIPADEAERLDPYDA